VISHFLLIEVGNFGLNTCIDPRTRTIGYPTGEAYPNVLFPNIADSILGCFATRYTPEVLYSYRNDYFKNALLDHSQDQTALARIALTDSDWYRRTRAIARLKDEKVLASIWKSDPSVDVREAARRRLDEIQAGRAHD